MLPPSLPYSVPFPEALGKSVISLLLSALVLFIGPPFAVTLVQARPQARFGPNSPQARLPVNVSKRFNDSQKIVGFKTLEFPEMSENFLDRTLSNFCHTCLHRLEILFPFPFLPNMAESSPEVGYELSIAAQAKPFPYGPVATAMWINSHSNGRNPISITTLPAEHAKSSTSAKLVRKSEYLLPLSFFFNI